MSAPGTSPGNSWGRLPCPAQKLLGVSSRFDALPERTSLLAFGNGRSYGDVCQNGSGTLLHTRGLDRFISFDPATGVLECEAGVLLKEIIDFVLPQGWFLPVTPGTAFVTVGGAIANDVHGKNHHRVGSFGNHLLGFELLRSDGSLECSAEQNPLWFAATIGGLGLTGLIRRAKLQLRRVPGPWIAGDSQRFANLRGFFRRAAESDRDYEYTVAWIDGSVTGAKLGRGIFMRGNHAPADAAATATVPAARQRRMPLTPPVSLVGSASVKWFNHFYFHRAAAGQHDACWHYQPFFHPLDGLLEWNRVYGPRGFFQYQCVVPMAAAEAALSEMLERIARSGQGSPLAVLKIFGEVPSRGLLSFPRAGATLALDFPNRGSSTLALLESLDELTRAAGGAVYPAKDARMSAASFQQYFPMWESFQRHIDPAFSSSFWRRVTDPS